MTPVPLFNYKWPMQSHTAFNLDDSNDHIAAIGWPQKSGTIDRLYFRCNAISGSPPDYEGRVETVATTTRPTPTGTLKGTTSNGTFTPSASTTHQVTLTTPVSVTKHVPFAIRLQASGTPSGTDYAQFSYRSYDPGHGEYCSWHPWWPVETTDGGSNWTIRAGWVPLMGARFDDGDFVDGMTNGGWATDDTFTSSTGLVGNRFTAPMTVDCVGGIVQGLRLSSSGVTLDWDFELQSIAGSQLAVVAITGDHIPDSNFYGQFFQFDTPYEIQSGTDYRLLIKCNSSSGGTGYLYYIRDCYNDDFSGIIGNGKTMYRHESGTDYTQHMYTMVPVIDLDSISGGGGGNVFSVLE